MKLYVGDYWVPFPSSEYGGIWVVTANSEEEAIKLLESERSWISDYNHLIPAAVAKARVFHLDPVHDHSSAEVYGHSSEIVDTFFT
jgi:hypothetical protein